LNKREVTGRGVRQVREECRSGTALIELPSVFTSRGFLYLYFRLCFRGTPAKLVQPLRVTLFRGGMNGRKPKKEGGEGRRERNGCVAPERIEVLVDAGKKKRQENEKEQESASEREKAE